MPPAGSIVRALYHKLQTQSSASEDGRNYRPKQGELIEVINKPLLLHLVGYLYYWQMGFNSVFKGLITPVHLKTDSLPTTTTYACQADYTSRTGQYAKMCS